MELTQIKHFLSVADTLNFTQAAERNDISQPALTRSIQKLEEEIGGILIVRDGKNTRLSELGQKIRIEFLVIIESESRAKMLAENHLHAGHSLLNIGIANSLGPAKFSDFIAKFLEQNENTRIVLHQIDQAASEEAILSGYLDACICTRKAKPHHKINITPLFDERLLLAFARNQKFASKSEISLEDFAGEKYLDRLNCEFRPDFLKLVERENLDIQPMVQSDREDWIQQLVATGKGICTLGEFSSVVPGIRMRPIEGIDMRRTVALAMIFGSSAPNAIKALVDFAGSYDWNSAGR